jgi:hypothetical protein
MVRTGWFTLPIVLACGGDGDTAPAGSGVKGSLLLSELSATQRTAVCKASIRYAYQNPLIEESCTLEAAYETTTLAECQNYRSECIVDGKKKLASERQESLDGCDTLDGSEYLNCEYTVEEYERCDREGTEGWEKVAKEASCLEAGEHEEDEDYPIELSDECQDVLDACYIE